MTSNWNAIPSFRRYDSAQSIRSVSSSNYTPSNYAYTPNESNSATISNISNIQVLQLTINDTKQDIWSQVKETSYPSPPKRSAEFQDLHQPSQTELSPEPDQCIGAMNSSRKRSKTIRAPTKYYCRVPGCYRSESQMINSIDDGNRQDREPIQAFATAKDRARHEASHNPQVRCAWHVAGKGHCSRVFSRLDNMKDHVRRVHREDN